MTAREALCVRLERTCPPDWVAVLVEEHRVEVLREAVALVALHVNLGAPPQRILTELRRMAAPTTTTQEQ